MFHITKPNWTQQLQSSGMLLASAKPCSRYTEAWSTLFPKGKSRMRLAVHVCQSKEKMTFNAREIIGGCPSKNSRDKSEVAEAAEAAGAAEAVEVAEVD